jgi:hypothetical protein
MNYVNNSEPGESPACRSVQRVGRPPAKHSSPDYAQMTVYIHKDVRNRLKMRLFQEGMELSALVEKLLSNWLKADRREE